ncbi:MAG: ABC transporter permease [Lachnospiraceae bacterium]|nr:ABC transporter permease [Lachnospiraceae bacterium]
MLNGIFSVEFVNSILRATTPILFATMASAVAAKAGICNMALEGMMLLSALFGVLFSALGGGIFGTASGFSQFASFGFGFLLTVLVGGVIGLIFAFCILHMKADEILAAIALNLIASGGTVMLLMAVAGEKGASSSVASVAAPKVVIPLIGSIPVLGEILSGQNLLTWLSILAVIVMHIFLYKTPMGLKIRAVGENKNAAESVGISARKIQYIALVISGMLASMGGFYLSGGYMNMFTREMAAGRGYIALAASSMGADTPVGGFLVSILFGIAQAVANLMQLTTIPMQLIQMIPYLTTLIGLGIYSYARMKRRRKLLQSE